MIEAEKKRMTGYCLRNITNTARYLAEWKRAVSVLEQGSVGPLPPHVKERALADFESRVADSVWKFRSQHESR